MTGVWGHLHPAAAASGDTAEARGELRRTLTASMRLGAAGCVAVVVAAPLLVQLVYTSDFLAAQPLIPVYFAGELGFMFLSVLGAYLLAVGQKRAYFVGYALYHGLLLAGVMATVGALGPWAYVLSHGLGAAVVALLAVLHSLRVGLLDRATLKTVGGCVLAAAACCALALNARCASVSCAARCSVSSRTVAASRSCVSSASRACAAAMAASAAATASALVRCSAASASIRACSAALAAASAAVRA